MRIVTAGGPVTRIDSCVLSTASVRWSYAEDNAAAIARHWVRRTNENPAFFNGRILMMQSGAIEQNGLRACFLTTDFKSFLHWREAGEPEAGVADAFGSALIRSAEGYVLLGRQRHGHVNSGLAYLPGGFIDERDIRADGSIDIDASIAREVEEETGLAASDLARAPGYILTQSGAQVSIGVEYLSLMDAESLRDRIETGLARDPQSELADIVIVRSRADLSGLAMPAYARVLLESLLPHETK